MIKISEKISINEDEIHVRFIRSPGPGGQHVNKVESAVQIRFDAKNNLEIQGDMYRRLQTLSGQKMTNDGVIIITSSGTRSQVRNKEIAIERLVDLLKQSSYVPKSRKKTKPSLASKTRRIEGKKHKGSLKKLRSKKITD